MKKLLLSSISALTLSAPAFAGQVTFVEPKTSGYCTLINVYEPSSNTTTPWWISFPYQYKQALAYAQGGCSITTATNQLICNIQANGMTDRQYYPALAAKNSNGQIPFTVYRSGVDAFCGISSVIDDWYSN